MLNVIVNRDKIKETYLSTKDTEFKIFFNSSDWHKLNKKAIFIVGNNSYVVENLEDNHTYPLPNACIGTEFTVFITGEFANSYKSTEKLLIRVMGGGSASGASAESTELTAEQMSAVLNNTFEGRDLTKVFADEIANYDDEWAWIRNRIRTNNFANLYVGDYIPLKLLNYDLDIMEMQIAGINTVTDGMSGIGNLHIDFISRQLFSEPVRWSQLGGNNNGNVNSDSGRTECNPFMASYLYKWMSTTLFEYLPDKVKNVISGKAIFAEGRYSDSKILTDSNQFTTDSFSPLWLPTEYEVFGKIINGTQRYDFISNVQYPLFMNAQNRFKYFSQDNGAYISKSYNSWWLATAAAGNSDKACIIDPWGGISSTSDVADYCYVPICFRVRYCEF